MSQRVDFSLYLGITSQWSFFVIRSGGGFIMFTGGADDCEACPSMLGGGGAEDFDNPWLEFSGGGGGAFELFGRGGGKGLELLGRGGGNGFELLFGG